MNKLAHYLSSIIMSNNKRDLDYEVVRYGVDAILSTVLCLGCAILIATLLDGFWFGILFIIFLTPIKMTFTGYHCKTLAQCICTYGLCVGFFTLVYNCLNESDLKISVFIFITCMCLIAYLVRHEIDRKTGIILLAYLIIGILFFNKIYDFYVIVCLSCIFELILLILILPNHIKK